MAAANLDTNKATAALNTITALTFTALDASDGGEYTVKKPDGKVVFVIVNTDSSNAENVTIKKPADGTLGVGTTFPDKVVSVAAGKTAVAVVESVRYMGANGKIKLAGSADVEVCVVEL